MYDIILSFITAFTLTYFAIPQIIKIAKVKHLTDEPGERSSHTEATPSLAGIGIFAGVIFSIVLWTPFKYFGDLQYILCAFVIIFLMGARDDILPLSPWKKLIAEIIASLILVFKSGIILDNLYGIFGVYEIPQTISVILTIFIIIVIINSFNLIDGINGLSGGMGVLITIFFGIWFFTAKRIELSIVAFSTTGALMAFLKYNVTPAKIFMGDTGSLFTGMVSAILVLKFIELNETLSNDALFHFDAIPAVAIGVLVFPLYDTLRVFTMRILRGRSPLSPDRNHIHHLLIDFGFSHMQATGILLIVNILFILFVYYFQSIGALKLLLLILLLATILTGLLFLSVRRKKLQKKNSIIQSD